MSPTVFATVRGNLIDSFQDISCRGVRHDMRSLCKTEEESCQEESKEEIDAARCQMSTIIGFGQVPSLGSQC